MCSLLNCVHTNCQSQHRPIYHKPCTNLYGPLTDLNRKNVIECHHLCHHISQYQAVTMIESILTGWIMSHIYKSPWNMILAVITWKVLRWPRHYFTLMMTWISPLLLVRVNTAPGHNCVKCNKVRLKGPNRPWKQRPCWKNSLC